MGETAAIVGGAALGGVIQGGAAKSAARTGAAAQRRASDAIQAAADRAREDVTTLFPQAQQSLLTGAQGAFDIFRTQLPEQQRLLREGNVAAQQSAAQGFDQARAALLGLPMGSFAAQDIPTSLDPFNIQDVSLVGEPRMTFLGEGAVVNQPQFLGLGRDVPALPAEATVAPSLLNPMLNIGGFADRFM